MNMKHDLSRVSDSTRNDHVVWQDGLSFHQEGNGKMDKAASSFIPAFAGSPYGWHRVGHREMLVGGCVCVHNTIYSIFSNKLGTTNRERRKRKEPKQLVTGLEKL